MQITEKTTVHELLETYPYLKDWLTGYAPEFKKLGNPVLYNTMARAATLNVAATMADLEPEAFLDEIRTQIATHEIVSQEAAGTAGQEPPELRARRQEVLKGIIRKLHDGASVDEVKAEFDALATEVDSAEIAAMEQALIAEGMAVEEVQRLCDVHVSVFKESLEASAAQTPEPELDESHPVAGYRRENVVIGEITSALRCAVEALDPSVGPSGRDQALADLDAGLTRLAEVDIHYLRKENQLFPVLETHGVEGPTKVMWGLDDDIRGRLKTARALLAAGDLSALAASLPETLGMVDDMVYKEEKILLPTALQVVTAEEWDAMAQGDAEIGFAWSTGPSGTGAPTGAEPGAASQANGDGGPMLLPLPTGALSLEQLDVMFRALPVDISFVDENDRVRFYSEGDRIFPRSPGAIGREVRNCHPPKSVDKVEAILAAFKAGEQDLAEFWIELGGRFIWIRYFAMRDGDGTYRGCLEVVQDATHVRGLTGQRRIVDW